MISYRLSDNCQEVEMVYEGFDIYTGKLERITTENNHIVSIEEIIGNKDDYPYISRCLVDMQVNGYKGVDYSSPDLSVDGIVSLCEELAKTGTKKHVPTIITNSDILIENNIRKIIEAIEKNSIVASSIVAIHIEGPFISDKDGPRGAHELIYVRDPSLEEFDRWYNASNGLLRIVTIAPERKGAEEFIRHAVSKGVRIAIGHCMPELTDVEKAVNAGASLSTHLGNGCAGMIPRLKNHIWKQLADDSLTAGIIADGYHVPADVLKVMYRTKGPDKIVLVSDVAPPGGLAPGDTKWGGTDVTVYDDGHLGLKNTEFLAGAGHLLNHDIPFFMKATGASLLETVRMSSDNPLKVMGIENQFNGFKEGGIADIISYNIANDRLTIVC